jgi:predicted ATPase/DNA-binding SARP family transcriptional activator
MMARLALSFLGAFQASREGKAVVGFESNKVRALFIYLAIESDRPHSREELAGFLWPDRPDQVARTNLRQALANLRQTLGDEAGREPYLLVTRESVQLNSKAEVYMDVGRFTSLLATAKQHLHRREEACHRCAGWLREAASLYHGDFLEHFFVNDSSIYEEWVLLTRERLRNLALRAFLRLSIYYERRGGYEDSLHYARRLVELDPWREEAHQQIIRALALSGQRSAALAQYKICRQVLQEEFGVDPSEETQSLYKRIKAGANPASFVCQPSHLPIQLTPFLGREAEVDEVSGLIEGPSCRLATIVGLGGIGKTRLALKVAEGQVGAFLDGVIFLPLASLSSWEFLVPAVARAVGLTLKGQQDAREQLLHYLGEKEILLVLDNFEHLLSGGESGGAHLVADLLRAAPHLSLLVTSRQRLNLQAEYVFHLEGLPYPPLEQAAEIESYSAVQLFLRQVRQVRGEISLQGDEARAVAQICRMVEGIPLAIEMAAAEVRSDSCRHIAQELEGGLQALATMMEDIPDRHRSMQAVFDHSWRLLSVQEQGCLQHLSVFRGGALREAAVEVAGADGELLSKLVDKSLLRFDQSRRYNFHEQFRQYASQRLQEAGLEQEARDDHLAWCLAFTEQADRDLYTADIQKNALERLEGDHDNLRAGLEWAIESRNAEAAARLGGPLSRFWGLRGYLSEGRAWMDKVLALLEANRPGETPEYARVLLGAGALAWRQGDIAPAVARMEASLAISQALGDEAESRRTLRVIATVESSRGNDDRAIALLQECLERDRRLGDQEGMAYDFGSLADSAYFQGNYFQAKDFYEESLAIHRERKDDYSIAVCLNNLGEIARVLGDVQGSAIYIQEAISLFHQLDIKQSLAMAIMNLGELELLLGEVDQAQARFCEALKLQQALNAWGDIACILPDFATLALKAHKIERAARLYAAASSLREAAQISVTADQLAEYQANIEQLRQQLGEMAFKAAWEAGDGMTLEDVVGYALRMGGGE